MSLSLPTLIVLQWEKVWLYRAHHFFFLVGIALMDRKDAFHIQVSAGDDRE